MYHKTLFVHYCNIDSDIMTIVYYLCLSIDHHQPAVNIT